MKPRIHMYLLLGWAMLNAWMDRFVVAAPQQWQPELVDELVVGEWPIGGGGGDDRNTLVDMLGQDSAKRGNKHGFTQGPPTDSSSGGGSGGSNNKKQHDDIDILYASSTASGIEARSSSRLQHQEEQDLERLDQSILDTLQHAIDTTQQNQPIRWISIEEATTHLLQSHSRWTILSSYWTSWTSSFVLWFGMMAVVAISLLVILRKKKSKPLSSRDCHPHHLPSFTVCKQKRIVD